MRTFSVIRLLVVMLTLCETASSLSQHSSRRRAAKTSLLTSPLRIRGNIEDMTTTRDSRGRFVQSSVTVMIATLFTLTLVQPDNAVALASYSSNARNMERLASGDASGGSSYDNFQKLMDPRNDVLLQAARFLPHVAKLRVYLAFHHLSVRRIAT